MSSKHDLAHQNIESRLAALEGGQPPSTQPIQVVTKPKMAADGSTLKQGVPITSVGGTYSSGTVTSRYRTRGSAPDEVQLPNSGGSAYTPVADDVGKMMRYYEVVFNSITNETKIVASDPVGPILPPDPTEPGEVEDFDFTSGTSHAVAVARSGNISTRRSGAATVEVMGANTKRYEHNAAGAQIGLLCEKSKKNYFPNAKNIGAVVSASDGATVTQNYDTAPDGQAESTRVVYPGGTHSKGADLFGIGGLPGIMQQIIWARGSQTFILRNVSDGDYLYTGPATPTWQQFIDQGVSPSPANNMNWFVYNDYTNALDIEIWGAGLQPGTGYQTLVLSDGVNDTRPKEVWTVTLAVGSVTRDIQIEDHLGQVQNFVDQVIGGGATWQLDADNITISPVIAKMRVYTQGSLGASPPSSPPPPPPPPSGWEGPTISMAGLIDFMETADDATSWASGTSGDDQYPPARQAGIQTPFNYQGVKYLCEYPRVDGGGQSNFYNEWDSFPMWLWLFRAAGWSATGKRIAFRNMRLCVLLDSPTGEWVKGPLIPDMGSANNTNVWNNKSSIGIPSNFSNIYRKESVGGSVLLTDRLGVEMWPNPGFYAIHDKSIMQRAYSAAGIVEIRVINDDGTPYTGSNAKPLASLGGDMYAPNVQNPRVGMDIPRGADGLKSRWKAIDCSDGNWHPVAFVTVDFCYKRDGPRPPFWSTTWNRPEDSWDVTGSDYNLTKAQLMANPPPFVV